MNSSKLFFSPSEYFILNKDLIKKIGLEPTIILCSLINAEELKKNNNYFLTTITHIGSETTLSSFKIKNGINKLYKAKFIDVIVKNEDKLSVKILHENILNTFTIKKFKNILKKTITQKPKLKHNRFKKPTIKELNNYFIELGINTDESDIMFDYYQSKGWKVGKAPMKCWKSAARNWARRLSKTTEFPDYYDKKIEKQICDDPTALSRYHNHLKKNGWESIYSPSSGTTWRKIKTT